MKLYIQRHCEPTAGERMDGSRQLTEDGIRQAHEMAAFLVREIGRVDITISSPFARASETAAIMAPALGSHVAMTRMLEPDGKPSEMWAEITRLAQQSKEVLVIGHHPSIGHLLTWLIAGDEAWDASGENIKFKHGAIAHLKRDSDDGSLAELHWFVTPKLVERDEDAEKIKEAAGALIESLKDKSRAKIVDPLIARAKKAILTRFQAQRKRVKKALEQMRPLLESLREAPQKTVPPIARQAILAALTVGIMEDLDGVLGEAYGDGVALGNDSLGTEYQPTVYSPAGPTGEIDRTTGELIGTALRDAFEGGLGYAVLVAAVDSIFDTAEESRAEMIATNEVSDALHSGMTDVADAASEDGLEVEKMWDADDDACEEVCQPNAEQGWIGADEDFDSGDDAPPGHPNCRCGLELRTASRSE